VPGATRTALHPKKTAAALPRRRGMLSMSTDFRALKTIQVDALFDGRLEQFSIHEHLSEETHSEARILSDGSNFVWVYYYDADDVEKFKAYGFNNPCCILDAIERVFETEIVSEHDCRFWGFDTQEEWDAVQQKVGEELSAQSYVELIKYLRNEPNDIEPGTIGMIKAEIAASLVAGKPELLLLENRVTLENAIEEIFERDHTVRVSCRSEAHLGCEAQDSLRDIAAVVRYQAKVHHRT
jgi:hypothetical protein